ncbi:hypothetical protein Shyhy01_29580 [Streptomyces hygroscopicus subsp. hygroscopicus]|uniref:hypothetical protein n=1 Tax=Streptomyces sp. KHY 26 TaxID=3097359 RepID=UPI0024A5B6A7|nr:hypothetical protein [Streptomyces hygroscopicus]GLX50008.1 hypothetical protein Shyhy01_29580 [Streptomyces hygroscopicus subsp. hygroscopicus]
MSLDKDLETRVAHAMRRAAGEFPPHSADLVRRSVARGRRMRWYATARIAVTAATVVAVGGTLMATDPFGGHGAGTRDQVRAGARAASGGQPSSRTPSSVSGEEMVRTLEGLLPAGGTVSAASGRASEAGPPFVSPMAKLTYSTAEGSSGIDVTLARLDPGIPRDQQGNGGCLPVEVRPYDTCTTERLPGGAVLNTTRSFTYPSSETGQKRWYVVLTRTDGVQLTVEEFGGGDEKGSSGGADPLLSIAQLTSIVRSPAWNKAISALPVPAEGSPSAAEPRVSGARMTRVLKSHLPRTGTVSDVNAGDGMVQLVYDDGHGKSMVEADAQYGMTAALAGHMGCAGVPGHCEATTLADGTRIKKVRRPSEKGGAAQVWLVDVLYPDGRRVVAQEVNSYAESGPVTRPRPALGMAELQSIARDRQFVAD